MAKRIMDPTEELLALLEKSPRLFAERMKTLAMAIITNSDTRDAEHDLAVLIANTMAMSDIVGRKRLLMEVDAAAQKKVLKLADPDLACHRIYFNTVPAVAVEPVVFEKAFDALVERDPRLAESGEEVKRIYGTGGFALARLPQYLSAEVRLRLTERIQGKLGDYIKRGVPAPTAHEQLAEIGGFSNAYAETVYRTNLATAYTAGRFREMQDPEIREVAPSLEYSAIRDADVRPNHKAADGLIAPLDHAVWDVMSPPAGHNCRCNCNVVSIFTLRERGLIKNGQPVPYFPPTFNEAHPDPGFKVIRTDRRIYGD
jgi:SPP1 gp7 family putative phage head morphogenesis protein